MLKKLMIRTWFGDLPPWTQQFVNHVTFLEEYGWHFLLVTNIDYYRKQFEEKVGMRPAIYENTRKAGDFDPFIGKVFEDQIKGFDYWGHYNLDAVYGRLDRWIPDSFLENLDIFANDPGAICGPFTVYKNTERINKLYEQVPTWRRNVRTPDFLGWDERDFNLAVQDRVLDGRIVMGSGFFQTHDHVSRLHRRHQESELPYIKIRSDGSLLDIVAGKEAMMFHFNQTRRWPVTVC